MSGQLYVPDALLQKKEGGKCCPITDVDSFEGRKYLHPVGNRRRFPGRARSLDTTFDCAVFHSCLNGQISACSRWTFLRNGASSETWISEQNLKTLFSATQIYVSSYFLVLLSFHFIFLCRTYCSRAEAVFFKFVRYCLHNLHYRRVLNSVLYDSDDFVLHSKSQTCGLVLYALRIKIQCISGRN
jgi:hypothetical protein